MLDSIRTPCQIHPNICTVFNKDSSHPNAPVLPFTSILQVHGMAVHSLYMSLHDDTWDSHSADHQMVKHLPQPSQRRTSLGQRPHPLGQSLHHAHLPCKDLCTPKHNFCTLPCDLGRIVLDPMHSALSGSLAKPGMTEELRHHRHWFKQAGLMIRKIEGAPRTAPSGYEIPNQLVTMLKTLCRSIRKLVDIDRNSHDCKCSKNP